MSNDNLNPFFKNMLKAMEPPPEAIKEPTGCIICGKDCDGYEVCVNCGVESFIEGLNPLQYVEKHNPERFKKIMDWYNQIRPIEPKTTD